MRYDPKAATLCLQEGDYDASISNVEPKTSQTGNTMEVVTFEVYVDGKPPIKIKEYFVEGQDFAAWKYKKLAQALGKEAEFKAQQFQAADCIGETLTVTLATKEDDFGEKNVIKGYSPKRVGAKPVTQTAPKNPRTKGPVVPAGTPLTEEDIPF